MDIFAGLVAVGSTGYVVLVTSEVIYFVDISDIGFYDLGEDDAT